MTALQRFLRKIKLNADLPLVGATHPRLYDPTLAVKVTETAQQALRDKAA